MALLPSERDRLTQCATGPWRLPVFLDVAAATGARRGEVLALRWSDVRGTYPGVPEVYARRLGATVAPRAPTGA